MFGYPKEEIIGKEFAILLTPEDREHRAPERELESAGVRVTAGDFRWQLRKDGSRFRAIGFVFGVVLSPRGGALEKILSPFQFVLGAKWGTGASSGDGSDPNGNTG